MKIKLKIPLGCIFLLIPLLSPCQGILAGQISGTHITHYNIEDLFISAPYWNSSDFEYMDLDGDGADDIYLSADWIYYAHNSYESARTQAEALGLLEISTPAEQPSWARMHASGDLIDHTLYWAASSEILYSQSTGATPQGVFLGEGYLAYRICAIDTLYGWIKIWNTTGAPSMTVYEYAYATHYVGIPAGGISAAECSIRMEGSILKLSLPENTIRTNYLMTINDLSGRLVFQAKMAPGSHSFNLTDFQRAFYLLRITDERDGIIVKKIVL